MATRRRFSRQYRLPLLIALAGALAPPAAWSASTARSAAAPISPPDCNVLAAWAGKYDAKDEWQVNPFSNRHRFASHFVSPETTRVFGRSVLSWSDADVQAVRKAAIDCRRQTKDRELSGRYNGIQSALAGRVANFAKAVGPARESAAAAMATLRQMPPSPDLLRLHLTLAKAGTAPGYAAFQRAVGTLALPAAAAAAPARQLIAALRDLPEEDIAALVTRPAEDAAAGMRRAVVDGMVADAGKAPSDPNGLVEIDRTRKRLAADFADVLAQDERTRVDQALAERRDAIADALAATIIAEIGKASQHWDDAFADIDRRAAPQVVGLLPPAPAARVREAAEARRKVTGARLSEEFGAKLQKLPVTEASLADIDAALGVVAGWPPSAASHTARLRPAAEERRAAILAELDRKEAGPIAGRIYQSADGTRKLEFVDRKRVLVSALGHTQPGSYTEEKDGRISIESEGMAVTFTREGRTLRGWDVLLTRKR